MYQTNMRFLWNMWWYGKLTNNLHGDNRKKAMRTEYIKLITDEGEIYLKI